MTGDALINRLKKRFKHLSKWAKRKHITCFRVYEKDLHEYPFICDYYEGEFVIWLYSRKKDENLAEKSQFQSTVIESVIAAFDISLKNLHIKQRYKTTKTQYPKLAESQNIQIVLENGLKFEINLSDYVDVGLFLDQRITRNYLKKHAKGKRILNLFAYTGSFSVYARSGKALSTTTVDLNPNYIEWAKRNFEHNHFKLRPSDRFITANCLAFLKQEATHHRYDWIICDPPTFSDSKKMTKAFDVNRDYPALIKDCVKCLAPGGKLIFSTNSRNFKWQHALFSDSIHIENITTKMCDEDFKAQNHLKVFHITKT